MVWHCPLLALPLASTAKIYPLKTLRNPFINNPSMQISRSTITLAMLAVGAGLMNYACGETKEVQCNKLVEALKKGQNLATPQPPKGATDFNKMADTIDSYTNDVDAVALSDDKLKGIKTSVVGSFRDISSSLREAGKAFESKDSKKLLTIAIKIKDTPKKLEASKKELETYCGIKSTN